MRCLMTIQQVCSLKGRHTDEALTAAALTIDRPTDMIRAGLCSDGLMGELACRSTGPLAQACWMGVLCRTAISYIPLNLGRLQQVVDQGRLDVQQRVVTMQDLLDAGAVHKQSMQNLPPGIKLLAAVSFLVSFSLHRHPDRIFAFHVPDSLQARVKTDLFEITCLAGPHSSRQHTPASQTC